MQVVLELRKARLCTGCDSIAIVAADKEQPLVTSMSADTMHLPAAAVLDIANTCSGPDGCSVGVLIRCIAKGGLLVSMHI